MATLDELKHILEVLNVKMDALQHTNRPVPAENVIVVSGLSDLSDNIGLMRSGEFRSGTGIPGDPGNPFSGVRIGYPAFTYDSVAWNIVGVNADSLMFGIRASDGTAVFGAGAVEMDIEGITIFGEQADYASPTSIKWKEDGDTSTSLASMGVFGDTASATFALRIGDDMKFTTLNPVVIASGAISVSAGARYGDTDGPYRMVGISLGATTASSDTETTVAAFMASQGKDGSGINSNTCLNIRYKYSDSKTHFELLNNTYSFGHTDGNANKIIWASNINIEDTSTFMLAMDGRSTPKYVVWNPSKRDIDFEVWGLDPDTALFQLDVGAGRMYYKGSEVATV